MNTMTDNFQTINPAPRSVLQAEAIESPQSLPLNRHPKWAAFLCKLGDMILDRHPDLRPPFLELLDQADLV